MTTDHNTIINDVSEILKTILEDNIPEISPNSVVFDPPADIQKSGKSGLSLFLYQISENPDLKNQEMQSYDNSKMEYPPLAVDLFYLLHPICSNKTN